MMRFRSLVAVVLFSVSCSHRPVPATSMVADDLEAYAKGPIFADPSLSGDLEIGQIEAARTESGRLRISIPFHNVSGERLQILCRVTFKDAAGNALPGDVTSDLYVGVPVGLTRKTVTSLKSAAKHYEVQVRRYEQ
ncbi:MAG: hypothetical protein KDC95_07030 [Planctomycetes bacterium]|nr:hypothetical protein [Planctomycetota bacterium]